MTGAELSSLHDTYRRICLLLQQQPDLHWLLVDFAGDKRYANIDLTRELRRFLEWHSDRPKGKRPKSHKRALRNWMGRVAPERPETGRSPEPAAPTPKYNHVAEAWLQWENWLTSLNEMDSHTFGTWLAPTRAIGMAPDNVTVVIAVPNDTFRDYLPTICKAAHRPPPFDVRFVTAKASRADARRDPAQD